LANELPLQRTQKLDMTICLQNGSCGVGTPLQERSYNFSMAQFSKRMREL
jgi:hypothetical protein